MKLFPLTFVSLLVGTAFAAVEDEVACIFNKFRQEANIEPLKISTALMQSANQMANYDREVKKMLLNMPGDKSLFDRMKRFGYEPGDAYGLAGNGYKHGKDFANVMVQKYPSVIRNPEFRHLGFAKSHAYSILDLGDSFNDDEPTKDAACKP